MLAAVVLVGRGADAPERLELLALLWRKLGMVERRPRHRAARDVVMDSRHFGAGLRGPRRVAAPGSARRLHLAPLAEQIHQQLLARGLHAIFAQRQLGGRLAVAQQPDAVAQAFRQLARVEEARLDDLGGARVGADRKSTRLNSSHLVSSYAVFCLTK